MIEGTVATAWHSPQSIYSISHRATRNMWENEVQAQEKVDGSFFAFGLFPEIDNGVGPLRVRSKGAVMEPDAPQAMFKLAVDTVKGLQDKLHVGWQYRGEVLCKPKHNALVYDRVPVGNIILFDILIGEEDYLPYEELKAEAERLGLEVVPQLFVGKVNNPNDLRALLDNTSILGGQKIEGIVLKPIVPIYGPDKKVIYAKFVSEAFKEVHRQAWGESNPSTGDIIDKIGKAYGTPARWQKSVLHLDEAGKLEHGPRDIGLIINEIPEDILKECQEDIKDVLFKFAWQHIRRSVVREFPAWYKNLLLTQSFEERTGEKNVESGGVDSSRVDVLHGALEK